MSSYFIYDDHAVQYLKSKDKKLAACIDQIGHINRPVDDNLFTSVIHQMIGQQISTKAQETIWTRMQADLGTVTPQTVLRAGEERIQSYGTTFRKASYICRFAGKVDNGSFNLEQIMTLPDDEVIRQLVLLDGIGLWTAEMIMLFGMQRQNILSFSDLAIIRGMRMIYRHREISRDRFEKYRKRYSPYGSVASLYLWAAAGGAIPGLTDPKSRKRRQK